MSKLQVQVNLLKKTCLEGVVGFLMIPNGYERDKISFFSMGETSNNVFYNWFPSLVDFKHCWMLNRIRIFLSLVGILNKLWRCRLQIDNLEKLIFANKNCPNDHKAGCKSTFSLIEFIEIDGSL